MCSSDLRCSDTHKGVGPQPGWMLAKLPFDADRQAHQEGGADVQDKGRFHEIPSDKFRRFVQSVYPTSAQEENTSSLICLESGV